MIDRQTIDRILDAANIVDVVSDFVTLKRAGANLKGLCPFHDDRTPSFMVSPSKNICKCFACGKGGTPVHFIMEHEQLTYPEALRYLAKKYHIEVKEREQTDEEKAQESERESLLVVNEWAGKWFQQQMNDTEDGRAVGLAYFRQRGFRDDIIKRFQLGFCPDKYDAQWQAAIKEGFKEEFILKTGLCIRNDAGRTYDRFRGRVIFPIHTVSGRVVGFGGRVLDSRTKGVSVKYQNSPESIVYSKKRELYGLFLAKQAIVRQDVCYLVEGYTDVMAMHQQGVENVVASSGTALTTDQINAIHRFTDNIVVIYDGDAAGIKASQRGIDMLLADGMNVKLLLLPDGDDPDSFARKHTAEDYQAYLRDHQVDFIRFKTDLLLEEAKGDPIKLSRLVNNIVDSLAVIPNEITRTFYIRETALLLSLNEGLIAAAVARVRQRLGEERQREREREQRQQGALSGGQDGLLQSVAQQPAGAKASPDTPVPDTLSPSDIAPELLQHQAFAARGTNPREAAILRQEQALMQMVVRHGEKIMCELEDEEGQQQPIAVAEFISLALRQDDLTLRSELHRRMLDEALAHCREEGFRSSRYFENHPDRDIANLAADLAHDTETLSRRYEKSAPLKPEEERLIDIVPHLIADYKLSIVEARLQELMRQMRDPVVVDDAQRAEALFAEYQTTKQIHTELAKKRGDRVFS